MTFSPRACNMPATTELSTPPDMATAIGLDIRRRQLPQMRNRLDQSIDQRIYLFDGVRASQRESNTRSRFQPVQAHRQENMRRLGSSAGASRAARYRESLEIQRDQQRVTVDSVKTNVGSVRDARCTRPVHVRIRDAAGDVLLQAIAQVCDATPFGVAMFRYPSHRAAQSHGACDVFRTAAPLALMTSAV